MENAARTIFEDLSEYEFFPAPAARPRPQATRETSAYLLQRLKRADHRPDTGLIKSAIAAIRAEPEHPASRELLAKLLRRPSLGVQTDGVLDAALAWLDHCPHGANASAVLCALIPHSDLGERTVDVIDRAIQWLAVDARTEGDLQLSPWAGGVLFSLMRCSALTSDQRHMCREFALARLRARVDQHDASQIFRALLHEKNLSPVEVSEVADLAREWLTRYGGVAGAPAVFAPLLGIRVLSDARWIPIAHFAFEWLCQYPFSRTHGFVLSRFAMRRGCFDGATRSQIIECWLHWITEEPVVGQELIDQAEPLLLLADGTLRKNEVVRVLKAHDVRVGFGNADHRPRLSEHLEVLLRRWDVRVPTYDLRSAIDGVIALRAGGRMTAAAITMVPLLPLVARWGDRELLDETAELAAEIVDDPRLVPAQRRGFVKASRALVNVWPDREEAIAMVEALCG